MIRIHNKEFGRAISALNSALKFIPKKDIIYRGFCYSSKCRVYKELNQYDNALNCINEAIRVDNEHIDLYEQRAQIYYELDKLDLSDTDYKKILSLDAGNVMGYMGLRRNAKERKDYISAIKHFDYVTELEPDYSSSYAFRGEVYLAQKNTMKQQPTWLKP